MGILGILNTLGTFGTLGTWKYRNIEDHRELGTFGVPIPPITTDIEDLGDIYMGI